MQGLSDKERTIRARLAVLAFLLFSVFAMGTVYLATNTAITVTAALSYAAGPSMVTLQCTFPIVFVIVPMSMGKGCRKGVFMALLFGLGATITITVYAVAIALFGTCLGIGKATTAMYLIPAAALLGGRYSEP